MVLSPNPRGLVIFGGKIKDSQRPTKEVPASKSAVEEDAAAPGGNIGHHGAGADQGSPQAGVGQDK